MSFKGKVAIVTGAANGIGFATAKALSEDGAIVWVTDYDSTVGSAKAKCLIEAGADVRFLSLDVTDAQQWGAVAKAVDKDQGRLDILVNCAGRTDFSPIAETSWTEVKSAMDINFGGAYLGTQASAPLMAKRTESEPWAAIINISSMAGLHGVPFFNSYAASKAALTSFTKTAALEFARLKLPIRVNSVHPGTIDTDMSAQVQEEMTRFGSSIEQIRENVIKKHPVGRVGEVDDVVYAILYLADVRASFTTGQTLLVSGGRGAGE